MEQWNEMLERHKRERVEALQSLSESGYTQTQAAKILGCTLSKVNTYAKRYDIDWRVKKQGQRTKVA